MRSDDNARIADWLLRLAYANRTWGFGLCFLWLRNVKGVPYNHKRVYRIYRQLELNLRIKPKRRLKRGGTSPKTVITSGGELQLDIPRDRLATFEPQLVAKYQRRLPGFDDHVISMYAQLKQKQTIISNWPKRPR